MKIGEFTDRIEKRIPRAWAEEWDNPGLSVGCADDEVTRVAVALDATEDTVARAADSGCQMLFTHHPAIFRALKSLRAENPVSMPLLAAVRRGVALYAAHTNWDSSPEGVNVILAEALGISVEGPIEPPRCGNGAFGIGVVGSFAAPVTMEELLALLKERWRVVNAVGYGAERTVSRAAIGGGACGDMWSAACEKGADVFITADISYHFRNDALCSGMGMVACDHGEMERASLPALAKIIEETTGLETAILHEEPVRRIH